MKAMAALASALALAGAPGPASARAPDIASCPVPEQPDGGEVQRTAPLPVPVALRALLHADRHRFAVATLAGTTVCIDTSWTESVSDVALSADKRFLTYAWQGNEANGTILIDRSGRGGVHEVGARPVFSPARRMFAAVDQTEAEFGSLSGFKVWRVSPTGISEAGKVEDIPRMNDWRIDGWTGETCVNLSAIPFNRTPDDPGQWSRARRDRFSAAPGRLGWAVTPSRTGCPAP